MDDVVVAHWRPGKLPVDLVRGLMQDWNGFSNAPPQPTTPTEMQRRILQVVGLRHGVLHDDNFTYRAMSTPALCSLFLKSLTVAAPLVRSVTLRLSKLLTDEEALRNLVHLFQNSPLLASIELIGNHDLDNPLSETESQLVSELLRGLGDANPPRLRRLRFRGMTAAAAAAAGGGPYTSLRKLQSLKILMMDQCSVDFMDSTFGGLMGHAQLTRLSLQSDSFCASLRPFLASLPTLRSFSGDCTVDARMKTTAPDNSQMLQSLPPLPHLQSLRLGDAVTRSASGAVLSELLQGLPHLQTLDLEEYSPVEIRDVVEFGAALACLPRLRDLTLGRTDAAVLAECQALTYMTCHFLPSDATLDVLLAEHAPAPLPPRLQSLEIERWMSDARLCALLQRLERKDTTLSSLTVSRGEGGPSVGQFLQQTLSVNTTLRYLTLPGSEAVVAALASLFTEQSTCLESLNLQNIRIDTTPVLDAVQEDSKLRFLSLHYKKLVPEARCSLRESLPRLQMTSLFVHFDGSEGTNGLHPDEFAPYLEQNKRLTSIVIYHNAKTQPAWDILSRLVGTRNRIRHMVAQQEEGKGVDRMLMPGVWPHIMESLVPDWSTTYVVIRDLFWPLQRMGEPQSGATEKSSNQLGRN